MPVCSSMVEVAEVVPVYEPPPRTPPVSPSLPRKKPVPETMKPECPAPEAPAPERKPASQPDRPGGQPWIVWLGLGAAVVIGVGLRFIPRMPEFTMPLVIGTLVTAGVLLVLKFMMLNSESGKGTDRKDEARNTKPPSRHELRKDSRSRVVALARRARASRFKREG